MRLAIARASNIWRRVCTKVWDPSTYEDLLKDVAMTLCILEMHLPPSFFDVMTHLLVHVVEELDLCGPLTTRWMYPIERYLKVLKKWVRNPARPEASMASGYILDEALGLASEYLIDTKDSGPRTWEQESDASVLGVVMEGASKEVTLDWSEISAMHHYVLENCEVVAPWIK